MSEDTEIQIPRVSNAKGILILAAAIPPLAVALHSLAGPLVAGAVCGVYAAALGLTYFAERDDEVPSRDPGTGLPDRAAALARLTSIFNQRLAGSSQAAVFVIRMADRPGDPQGPDCQQVALMATARLAQGLRRGDQIIRIGERSLAAILAPSRGLTTRAAQNILDRIDGMFVEPLRIGSHVITPCVSLGACLQHDAPKADAASWLEAAEMAALIAAEDGEPRLFPSGATRVDRSAWDNLEPSEVADAGDANWLAATEGSRADDTAPATRERRRSA